MRFMMLLKADQMTESGALPRREDLEVMGKYNQELIDAGVLLDAAGLQRTAKGAKVIFKEGRPQVTDGPFVETKELIAGYWMIKVNSRHEAIEWAKRAPFDRIPSNGRVAEIELRQVCELEDFQDVPPEVRRMEESLKPNRGDSKS
jgi:hypothetical protein